jgi:phosphoenolpyruvate phosphomutase
MYNVRLPKLRTLINTLNRPVRVIETHSGLCGVIASNARGANGETFDAVWSSSLTSSLIKGKPDIEAVDTTARIGIVEDILEVTDLPMIYDGDTGGNAEVFRFTVRSLERLGVSAVVIEDKAGLKQNSLFGTDRKQQLEDIDTFCAKIAAGKAAQTHPDFMVCARMESLIAGYGEDEALMRAQKSIEAGADAIMIHSKEKSPDEVFSFLEKYSLFPVKVPVIAVPTTYNAVTEVELGQRGASVVIHANHLLRAAYPVMMSTAESILTHNRSQEVDAEIMGVKPIITLIDDHTSN